MGDSTSISLFELPKSGLALPPAAVSDISSFDPFAPMAGTNHEPFNPFTVMVSSNHKPSPPVSYIDQLPCTAVNLNAAFLHAVNKTGMEILMQLLRKEQTSIFISPISIGSCLAMALYGARGETQSDMLLALTGSPG